MQCDGLSVAKISAMAELRALMARGEPNKLEDGITSCTSAGGDASWGDGPALLLVLGAFSVSLLAVDKAGVDDAFGDIFGFVSKCSGYFSQYL